MSSTTSHEQARKDDPLVTYINLVIQGWDTDPSELAKTQEGRRELRAYVKSTREAYKELITICGDPVAVEATINFHWISTVAKVFFRSDRTPPKIFDFPLSSIQSSYPQDPLIIDEELFKYIVNIRTTPPETFADSSKGQQLHQQFIDAWVRFHLARDYLSNIYYMMREIMMEQIVTIESEWRSAGIVSDEDDKWLNAIPYDVVPYDVQMILENDDMYRSRMKYHDTNPDSELFFGFPVGARFPVDFLGKNASLSGSNAEDLLLEEMTAALQQYNWARMSGLGNAGNKYLRSRRLAEKCVKSSKNDDNKEGTTSSKNETTIESENDSIQLEDLKKCVSEL